MEGKLIKVENGSFHLWLNVGTKNADHIASDKPLMGEWGRNLLKYKLSTKNCQAIENGYDLDELAKDYANTADEIAKQYGGSIQGDNNLTPFKDGFQKALEILGNKKFSEEQVISMIRKSRETGLTAEYLILAFQQTEWDVTFNPEEKDSKGCLILKRKQDSDE